MRDADLVKKQLEEERAAWAREKQMLQECILKLEADIAKLAVEALPAVPAPAVVEEADEGGIDAAIAAGLGEGSEVGAAAAAAAADPGPRGDPPSKPKARAPKRAAARHR